MKTRFFLSNFTWRELFLVFLVGALATIIWGIHSGQDLNPDFVNYHFYNAYLVFNKQRLLTDIFPAGIQGYLNPYLYVLTYILYKIFTPKEVGVILATLHSICFISVYLISRQLLANWSLASSRKMAFALATFGTINPFFVALIGGTFSDIMTPPLILIPLALIMFVRFPNPTDKPIASNHINLILMFSGILIGTSVGFKLTNCAFVLGLMFAWLVAFRFTKQNILATIILFVSIGLGFLLVDGEWMWRLYSEFKNPLFPFYNNIFKSPMIGPIDTNVPAWAAAHSFYDFLVYPYRWVIGIPPVSEWNFADSRFAMLYTIAACLIVLRLITPFKKFFYYVLENRLHLKSDISNPKYITNRFWFITIWAIISYLFWIDQFGALRYLLPVTLISGVLMWIGVSTLFPYRKFAITLWIILASIALITMQPPYFGRVRWKYTWYPVHVPQELLSSKNTLYLKESLSFIIPFFPKDAQFISLGYLVLEGKLPRMGDEIIAKHQGPIRTLTLMPMNNSSFYDNLQKYGLKIDPRDCISFMGGVYPFQSCKIVRLKDYPQSFTIPLGTQINFNTGQTPWIKSVNGFSGLEAQGMWTNKKTAEINLTGVLPKGNFKLQIVAPYIFGDNATLPFKLTLGKKEQSFTFTGNTATLLVHNSNANVDKIVIKIPHPISPHTIDPTSQDTRELGLMLQSIKLEPVKT